jgi:hypothetical protein
MEKELYLKIGRPQNVCVRCGAPIAGAGKHPSAIIPAKPGEMDEEDGETIRQDFCTSCWEASREREFYSFWIARREKPKTPKRQTRKDRNATLASYFDFLYQKGDAEHAQHLFFLAHLLMKFQVLRWVRTEPPETPEGRERIVFRNTVTDDFVTIESLMLDEDRLVVIKREIDEFIERALSPQDSQSLPNVSD